jgi:ABC-type phosphate transport system substrate-binding protein/predicted acylesterase/phospholipase RssA
MFFHLGVVRALRDVGILTDVAEIHGVSGGAILAAHLVINWKRYNGTPDEFDAVAGKLIEWSRRDVRGRVLRRAVFPWINRIDTLESEIAQLLGPCLLKSTARDGVPTLHVIATNITKGLLSEFSSSGLRQLPIGPDDETPPSANRAAGNLRVSQVVTASCAFPWFVEPFTIRNSDLLVPVRDWAPQEQEFLDGGGADNRAILHVLSGSTEGAAPTAWIASDASKPLDWAPSTWARRPRFRGTRAALRFIDVMWNMQQRAIRLPRQDAIARGASSAQSVDVQPIIVGILDGDDRAELHSLREGLGNLRTDLDRFDPIEIDLLMRRGYSVACRRTGLTPEYARLPATGTAAAEVPRDAVIADEVKVVGRGARRRLWTVWFGPPALSDPIGVVCGLIALLLLIGVPWMGMRMYSAARGMLADADWLAFDITGSGTVIGGLVEPFRRDVEKHVGKPVRTHDLGSGIALWTRSRERWEVAVCSDRQKPEPGDEKLGGRDNLEVPVAGDRIVVVTHVDNPLASITREQLQQVLFTTDGSPAKLTWGDLGVDRKFELAGKSIDVIMNIGGNLSGTRAILERELAPNNGRVMVRFAEERRAFPSPAGIPEDVRSDPAALGIVSAGLVGMGGTKELKVTNGPWRTGEVSRRALWIYVPIADRGTIDTSTCRFLDWMLSEATQEPIAHRGFARVRANQLADLRGKLGLVNESCIVVRAPTRGNTPKQIVKVIDDSSDLPSLIAFQ